MTQTEYKLPGEYLTIRLNNAPLARWLLEQEIAIPQETMGVAYACRANERGQLELRIGWERPRELEGYGFREALLELTAPEKHPALLEALERKELR